MSIASLKITHLLLAPWLRELAAKDPAQSQIAESFIGEYQRHLDAVDGEMTAYAAGIDQLRRRMDHLCATVTERNGADILGAPLTRAAIREVLTPAASAVLIQFPGGSGR